jgi:hypothetical protein
MRWWAFDGHRPEPTLELEGKISFSGCPSQKENQLLTLMKG